VARRLAHEMSEDREIVRCEIPQYIGVVLEDPEIHPYGVEVVQVAELSAVDDFFDLADGTRVDEGVVHHQHAAHLLR
jgi:hypothetical protein